MDDRTDDLLRPSLGADDDALDFDAPWNPWSLMYASFFGGLFTAGLLYAVNFRRLGQPRAFLPCLAGFSMLALAAYATVAGSGALDADDESVRRNWRLGLRVLTVACAALVATQQRRRFQLFERSGGESAPLLVPGLLAVLAGAAVTFVLMLAFVALSR